MGITRDRRVVPGLTVTDLILSRKLRHIPGRLSWMTKTVTWLGTIASLALVIGADIYFGSRGRPYQPPAIAFQGDTDGLRQSVVVPTLDSPMPHGKSVVWCGTLQLAWNHLGTDVLHGPPKVRGAEEVAARLNQSQLAEGDLPPSSFLATAGFAKDGIIQQVTSQMKQRFHKDVKIDPLGPNHILAYAYLEANAAFSIPFFDAHKRCPSKMRRAR